MPCAKLDYADELVQVTLWLPDSGQALPRRLAARLQEVSHADNRRVEFHQLETRCTRHRRDVRVPTASGSCSVEFGDFTAGLLSRVLPLVRPAADLEPNQWERPRRDEH